MLYVANSILAIDTSPFGQSLALLPVMRALRAAYPKTCLVVAAPNGTCELLGAGGLVDDTISLGVIKPSDGGGEGGLKRFAALFRHARRYNFDLVLDFSPSLESQIVSRLVLRARVFTPARLPRVIGMLLDLGGASRAAGRSTASDYGNVLQQAGVEMKDERLAITLPAEEDARFEHRLSSSGSRGGELIALLYASNPSSRRFWPVDAFGEIGTRLANNFNARIVAADEPSDSAFTRAVSALLPPGTIKLAEPRAMELIAAIARSSIVITDEPAIARIASELATPVIEIAEAISATTASSTTHRIAQGSSRSRVPADEVYEIASEMIQENRSASLFQRS
jgi:ADP-heptose:LPS heptosyltransferase